MCLILLYLKLLLNKQIIKVIVNFLKNNHIDLKLNYFRYQQVILDSIFRGNSQVCYASVSREREEFNLRCVVYFCYQLGNQPLLTTDNKTLKVKIEQQCGKNK